MLGRQKDKMTESEKASIWEAAKIELAQLADVEVFAWPTADDELFTESADKYGDAVLTQGVFERLIIMADGYKRGADLLVVKATKDSTVRDFFVYPIIFCYRHYIELTLKYMLYRWGFVFGMKPNWSSHDIEKLWDQYETMLGYYTRNEADEFVRRLIKNFSQTDPGSSTFRYPTDTKGEPTRIAFERVDLAELARVMKSIEAYFEGTDGFLADHMPEAK